MKQIERIKQMEQWMDTASEAVKELEAALDKFAAAQEAIAVLSEYYGSEDWLQDFNDDEEGRLPKNLKRGVLSEDGIWNLLTECRELNVRMSKMVTEVLKRQAI